MINNKEPKMSKILKVSNIVFYLDLKNISVSEVKDAHSA